MSDYLDHYFRQIREMQRILDQPHMRALNSIPTVVREQMEYLASLRDTCALPIDYLSEFSRIRESIETGGRLNQFRHLLESENGSIKEMVERQRELDNITSQFTYYSDLASPSQRVLEALSSTEALLETAHLRYELLGTAVQPHIAYQEFARKQLELASSASEGVRANRLTIVDTAADLLEEMGRGFELTALMYSTDLGTGEEPEPELRVNVFTELTLDIEGTDLEKEGADPEDLVLESKPAQVTSQGGKIVRLIYDLNVEAEREGKPAVFKPTSKTLYSCSIIPSHIATDERSFSDVVDHLYFLLYEGSGSAARLTEKRPADHLEALWRLKHLRLGFRHDVDHGSENDVVNKNRQVGEAYTSLIGKVAPHSKADWIEAQISLYEQLVEMLEDVWFEDDEDSDAN